MTANEGLSWWERVRFFIRARQRLRGGVGRLREGWWQIFQTAVAAGVVWLLAVLVLGNDQPEFAPIAAVISLGLAVGQRTRRVDCRKLVWTTAVDLGIVFYYGVAGTG